MKIKLRLVLHNIRSAHNVGSILRTADGMGVEKIYFSGYTPYPEQKNDPRMPHIRKKVTARIHKTALGAETNLKWQRRENIAVLIEKLKSDGWLVAGLEQAKNSTALPGFEPSAKTVIVAGNEINGLDDAVLRACAQIIEIPMLGKKESYNVAEATSVALYHCRFYKKSK